MRSILYVGLTEKNQQFGQKRQKRQPIDIEVGGIKFRASYYDDRYREVVQKVVQGKNNRIFVFTCFYDETTQGRFGLWKISNILQCPLDLEHGLYNPRRI